MKVLAINSSPNKEKGNTALILTPFLKGMEKSGVEVELFYTNDLKIKPCQGEFSCWIKSPGECFLHDDMQIVLPKFVNADVIVLATPVYVDGVTGPMKNLLDRILPILQPFFEVNNGHSRHPIRERKKLGKLVLVSNCGFWEMDNFDPILIQMAAICKNLKLEFAGSLLRPHGPALKVMQEMGMPVDDIFQSAEEAGCQLAKQGRIQAETLQVISRELLPLEMYIEVGNQKFQEMLDLLDKEWNTVTRYHGDKIKPNGVYDQEGSDCR